MADDGGTARAHYGRVLLKLSGEAFAPADAEYGINTDATALIARQLAEVVDLGVQTAVVVGGGNIWRGRQAPGHRSQPRRLHGHARHGDERAGAAGRAREDPRHDPGADRDRDDPARRAVHAAARPPPPREGPRRDLRGRPGGAVLLHRHVRGSARPRDRRRRAAQGHEGRRRLHRRPGARRLGRALRRDRVRRGAEGGLPGDGRDRDLAVHGEQAADHRLQPARGRQHPPRGQRRARSARSSTEGAR